MAKLHVLALALLTLSTAVNSHGNDNHPIGKLIRGTFISYDESSGGEFARLYVCKAAQARYYWSVIKAHENTGNYMIANGVFNAAGIDYHDNFVTNSQCFALQNLAYHEVSACSFDVLDLCEHKEVSLLFTFESQATTLGFVKLSKKDELIGNEAVAPYQCGIPWTGEVPSSPFPFAVVSDPLLWSSGALREVQVYTGVDTGCWAYVPIDDSQPNTGFGEFFDGQRYWDGRLWIGKWSDQSVPSEDVCSGGAEINIRVAEDAVIIGFICTDDTIGDGYVFHATSEYDSCPIP